MNAGGTRLGIRRRAAGRDAHATVALDTDVATALGFLAKEIKAGNCVLFLGAAVHAPPPMGSAFSYPPAERPPIGPQLSRMLAEQCDLASTHPHEDPENLQRVSLFYEIKHSRGQLVNAVREAVQDGKTASPMVKALAELGFRLVVTTNYDRLFETALTLAGRTPRLCVYSPDNFARTPAHKAPTAETPVLYKIHGDALEDESIVITDEDYIQFVLRMSDKGPFDPIPLQLKYYLTNYTTLIVGYSLLDYNLRLLFKTLRWGLDPASIPETYSVVLQPDPLILNIWHNNRRYVKFIVQDVWSFVPSLYQLVLGKEIEP